jgi:hypothetical protein
MKNRFWILTILSLAFTVGAASAQTKRKKNKPQPAIPVTTQQIIEQNQPEIVVPETQTPLENQSQPVTEYQNPNGEPTTDSQSFQSKIDEFGNRIKEISTRVGSLEASRRGDLDEKQRRLLLNLEILSRAEQRAESLRQKLFELTEKESTIKSRLDQIEYESSEEVINRSVALAGGLRPEVLREQRRKALDGEKTNLNNLLRQIQSNRTNLEENVTKADLMVEKLRLKLEKEIDDALAETEQ